MLPGDVDPVNPASNVDANTAYPPSPRSSMMYELREATLSPTPLSELLQDPVALKSLIGHKKKSHRDSSRDHERGSGRESRKRDKDSDTSSILTLVLAEEERQAQHLKAVLRTTGDRLHSEIRRADQAEARAREAENRAREALSRASASETARHQVELDGARAQEEVKRYQLLAEAAEREVRRAEANAQRSERLRADAEQNAADARDIARKAQQALREYQARERGLHEGRVLEARRRYNDGRDDGYEDGRAEGYETGRAEGFEEGREQGHEEGRSEGFYAGQTAGFEEGKKSGWIEGFEEGRAHGRREEREHALEAFDKFIETEIEGKAAGDGHERTQRWIQQVSAASSGSGTEVPTPVPGPIPMRAPSPQPVREPSPPRPVPWLHRKVNMPSSLEEDASTRDRGR